MTACFHGIDTPIETIKLFYGSCRHAASPYCLACFQSGMNCGWGELALPDVAHMDILAGQLSLLKGLSFQQAFELLNSRLDVFSNTVRECAGIALLDLAGMIMGKSALDLLELPGNLPVSGAIRIRPGNPDEATSLARNVLLTGIKSYLLIELPGKPETDIDIIRSARQATGQETFIVGHCRLGYGRELKPLSAALGKILRLLKVAGLDACAAPARLNRADWDMLQKEFPDLYLIPDAFPEEQDQDGFTPCPNRIYAIQAGTCGSIFTVAELAKKVTQARGFITVNHSSRTDAGEKAWRQLAIGMTASWCEITMKPWNAPRFCATWDNKPHNGKLAAEQREPGFGLRIDPATAKLLAENIRTC